MKNQNLLATFEKLKLILTHIKIIYDRSNNHNVAENSNIFFNLFWNFDEKNKTKTKMYKNAVFNYN